MGFRVWGFYTGQLIVVNYSTVILQGSVLVFIGGKLEGSRRSGDLRKTTQATRQKSWKHGIQGETLQDTKHLKLMHRPRCIQSLVLLCQTSSRVNIQP